MLSETSCFDFLLRVPLPVALTVATFIGLYINDQKRVSGKRRSYVALSLLMFYYGSLNIGASLINGWLKRMHDYSLTHFPHLLESFLHRQADNIVIATVGIALFAAMDAATVTKDDVIESEQRILWEMAAQKASLCRPIATINPAQPKKCSWLLRLLGIGFR